MHVGVPLCMAGWVGEVLQVTLSRQCPAGVWDSAFPGPLLLLGRCFSWHTGTHGRIVEQERGCLHLHVGILLGEAEAGGPGQSCR